MEAIKELPQSGVFVIGVDKYYQEMLRSSPDTNLQIMADSYQVHQEFEDIFRLVQEGKGVFIDNHGYLEYTIITKFTKRGVASLRIMKECLSSHPVAMALQRHSPLKGKIDKIIGRLLSGGLIRRFFLDSIRLAASAQNSEGGTEESNSDGRKESTSVPLSLDHMQGIFFICAIGWLVSIGAFLVESMSSASLFEDNREGAFVNG
ncbi:uncharacterized protein LOC135212321 [Macrobrachium nipponense]|uniref:uncharacterized protein LOC135212321 n=1 Tax=Macrobrachium nipponense TaxID=159736 RepID=UPI0030C8033E